MKPEEKAKELIDKFLTLSSDDTIEKRERTAKNCAMILVNEVIQSYPTEVNTFNNNKGLNVVHVDNRSYWMDVKKIFLYNKI